MKRFLTLLLLVILAITLSPRVPSEAQTTLTVMTANVQHGQGTDNVFNFQRQVDAMAGADIIAVQERTTTETGWNSPMSTAGLSQACFKAHWGSPGDGSAVWVKTSTVTVLQDYTFDMANGVNPTSGSSVFGWNGSTDIRRSLCAIKAQVGSRQFYVISLHLVSASGEDSSNTNFASQRVDQINSALAWASSTLTGGLPRIWAGDFNLPPNYPRAPERTYTADSGTDIITSASHGFSNGTAVALRSTGSPPGGLAVGSSLYAQATVYYVRDATTDTFKLAATSGGSALNLTSNGTGSNFVSATQWDLFHSGHFDLWQEGLGDGRSTVPWDDRDSNSVADNPVDFQLTRTHDTRRIDYIMLDRAAAGITMTSISVPEPRAACSGALIAGGNFPHCPDVTSTWQADTPDDYGVKPADHSFVKAVFGFSGVKKCNHHTNPQCVN